MKDYVIDLPQEIYNTHLKIINNVKFSRREIDIIACILHGRTAKKIASLLSISSKTVVTHTHNVMLKLECNSQERIRDFIEKSHKFEHVRRYYSSLLIYIAFEKCLNDISKLKDREHPTCLFVCWRADEKTLYNVNLEAHLKLAGLKVSVEVRDIPQSVDFLISESLPEEYVIYALSKAPLIHGKEAIERFSSKLKITSSMQRILFLFSDEEHMESLSETFSSISLVNWAQQTNYYLSFFEILKKLLPEMNLEHIIKNFIEHSFLPQVTGLSADIPNNHYVLSKVNSSEKEKDKSVIILKTKKWPFFITGAIVTLLFSIGYFFVNEDISKLEFRRDNHNLSLVIRSNLLIPNDNVYVARPEVLTELENILREQKSGIQTVAFVGPGGVGKTTLARFYARKQQSPVIWEINAETDRTLKSSFENLALALAKTELDQKILRGIQDLKNSTEREERIIQFVIERMRSHPNWLLIFDNVENFIQIQKYFPHDPIMWGHGKILLTTRDKNIQNNKIVNHTIDIRELNSAQKLDLFSKIMHQGTPSIFTSEQLEETKKFLESIPSFPLDISIAAYYLKSTKVSYSTYLKNLTQNHRDFIEIQENLAKESGDYPKTRYEIISLSLQRLINTHKDFETLLLFISLLDSQKIPRDLLDKYKTNVVVDNFIYHLNKYSLISNEPLISSLGSTFSIHRSTQDIILAYLNEKLKLEKNKSLLPEIATTLANYLANEIEKDDYRKMKHLTNHCEAFLNHTNLLSAVSKASLKTNLAFIRGEFKDYKKGKKILEENIPYLNATSIEAARALTHLGIIYKELSDNEKARDTLVQSLSIYNKHFPTNYSGIARTLSYLGDVYRILANNEKAKESLEQSLSTYKIHLPEYNIGIARTLSYLGILYVRLGDYRKAKNFFEESLQINENMDTEGRAQILVHAANNYRELGDLEKAKELLEKSLILYTNYYPDDHIDVAWSLGHLGNIYRYLGKYKEAKALIEKSVSIHLNNPSQNQTRIAWIYVLFGSVYRSLGDYPKARDLMEKSVAIYKNKPNEPSKVMWALAHLGNVYRNLGDYEKAKNLIEESLRLDQKHYTEENLSTAWALGFLGSLYSNLGNYEKSRNVLEKSISISKKLFSENYIGTAWATAHLGNVYRKMGNYEKAQQLLEKSLFTYQNHLSQNHVGVGWLLALLGEVHRAQGHPKKAIELIEKSLLIHNAAYDDTNIRKALVLSHMGNAYKDINEFEKANILFEKSLTAHEKNYGRSHLETARVLKGIGEVHLFENQLEKADNLFHEVLEIFQKSAHPDIYLVLEDLAELNFKKSAQEEAKNNTSQAQVFKAQAISYLKQALDIVKTHFPEDSLHIQRIQMKLKNAH